MEEEEARRYESEAKDVRAQTESVLKENAILRAKLQAMEEQELRLQHFANSQDPSPFQFTADSTPIKDIQIAYRFLPDGVLTPEQIEELDQAVDDGDIYPVIDIINNLANTPEYENNRPILAIDERASDNEESPNAYYNNEERMKHQKILSVAILLQLI
ncbi:UNVERIFIED_CONTAM: hypothetical protein HDU68_005959 [Siphonaria sp. JEL0065]|nr:hypothetical protein HDU68_005959 [Siphonaria sp. JEL0065]